MNASNESAPRVAVLGATLHLCRDTPGFRVDLLEDGDAEPADHRYDLVHAEASVPSGTSTLDRGEERTFLSPGRAGDHALAQLGVPAQRIRRWRPGVDREQFTPAAYSPNAIPDRSGGDERVMLLSVGPLEPGPGLRLLTAAFAAAHDFDPRIHLLLAGAGSAQDVVEQRFGSAVTLLGPLEPDRLAQVYASADLLVFTDPSDLLAEPILRAQSSGLPVLAIDGGGAPDLIQSGRSGCLVAASTIALAEAIGGLARRATLRERLVTGALMSIDEHSRERSLERLARLWWSALERDVAKRPVAVARAA